MGRNNGDFSVGKTPEIGDVSKAHAGGKITHEEASDLSIGWRARAIGMRPRLSPTSDNKRAAIHKKAGLNE